jgi:CAP-Gly domain-containing linker protein 1
MIFWPRFDLHDTEDCPTQSMQQEEEETAANTRSGGVRGIERPYCEKCEVFGHPTETCNVADSY